MKSKFKIKGAELYRTVGVRPKGRIFKLPYIDMQGRNQPLKEIKKISRGKSGAYRIQMDSGDWRWVSVSELETNKDLLILDPIVIHYKEKGMPF